MLRTGRRLRSGTAAGTMSRRALCSGIWHNGLRALLRCALRPLCQMPPQALSGVPALSLRHTLLAHGALRLVSTLRRRHTPCRLWAPRESGSRLRPAVVFVGWRMVSAACLAACGLHGSDYVLRFTFARWRLGQATPNARRGQSPQVAAIP